MNEIDLANTLSLPDVENHQDWGIEFSDPASIDEFIACLRVPQISQKAKAAATEIIMASIDDALEQNAQFVLRDGDKELILNGLSEPPWLNNYWANLDPKEFPVVTFLGLNSK